MNPLTVQYVAKQRGVLSIFSDGDGRILVGESVITSVVNSWVGMFVNTTQRAMAGTLNNTYQDMCASSFYLSSGARLLTFPQWLRGRCGRACPVWKYVLLE